MSVKLMSAIFETEFRDLVDEDGNVTKASTAKLVLLALADHANDEGEGAYPGLTKMQRKTALTRPTIVNTYDALKYNGIIFLEGTSKLGTNNYTINVKSFPKMSDNEDGKATLLVKPLDGGSKATLPPLVKPVYPNHPLTTNETSNINSPADTFKDLFGRFYGKKEEIRWTALFEAVGKDKAEKLAQWAFKKEIHLVNRPSLLDSMETAARNWYEKQAKPKQPGGFDVIKDWLEKTTGEVVNG